MFIRKLLTTAGIAALSASLSLPALAHTHRGTATQGSGFDREVTLGQDAKYLNVTQSETVKINAAGKSFVWRFDTLTTASFDLGDIDPALKGIRAYVTPDPLYIGGQ